jgi:ABC-type transport system substrate-binding protein
MDPRQGNTPQGTGPFQLEEFQDEGFARFSKFDDYWFDTSMKDWYDGPEDFPNGPVVDEVDVSIIPDPAQRSAALQSGELDHARGLNANTLPDFEDSEDYRLASSDGAGFTFMQYPVEVEPFNNAKIRRAINHLIPRQQIANEIFNGYENPANVPCPPIAARLGTTDYQQLQENLGSYSTYSVDRADELVEQAMEEQDIETPIEVTIRTNANNDNRVSTVELIAQAVSQSEYFEGDTETVADLVTLIGQLYQPSFAEEGIFTFVGLSGGFNPHGYAKAIHHPDNYLQCCNFQNINIERLNEGLQEARYGTDVVEDQQLRKQRYEDVWEIILEENANSYGTFSKTISVVTDAVKGFNSYPSVQDVIGYGLYSPMEQQITYLARE